MKFESKMQLLPSKKEESFIYANFIYRKIINCVSVLEEDAYCFGMHISGIYISTEIINKLLQIKR